MAKLIDITGKALSGEWGTDDESGDGIPVLRTTNFTNEGVVNYNDVVTRTITKKNIDEKFLRKGDIIIEKSGGSDKFPVGRVIYFDGDENTYLFNNFTGLLRVKDQDAWYPRYVFYSLFANYKRGGTRAFENKTTGLHNLKTDDYVSRYEIAETDKAEQISICDKLDRLYGIIKSREKELQLLDDLIKARFVEMFGEYYLNHINEKQLDEICDFIDYRGKTPEKSESGIPLITAKNVKDNRFSIEPQEFIPEENYDDVMTRGIPRVNDVLFTTEAPLGNVCRIPDVYERFCVGQRLITMQPHTDVINSEYLEHALASAEFQEKMWQKSSGSTVKGIRSKLLVLLMIPVPPIELQNQFRDFVHQVDKSKVAVQKALDETQLLFDSLMQTYFG